MTESNDCKLEKKTTELQFLYELNKILFESNAVNKTLLDELAICIMGCFCHKENMVVEICFDQLHSITNTIPNGNVYQQSLVVVNGEEKGYIRVHYRQIDLCQFLPEEELLLNIIALKLGGFIEKNRSIIEMEDLKKEVIIKDRLAILGENNVLILHDLSGQLSNIIGYLNCLELNFDDIELKSDIVSLTESIEFCHRLIKKSITFCKESDYGIEEIKVKEVIDFAIVLLRKNLRENKITLEVNYEDANENISVEINSIEMTQVLFNLIVNSIHASPSYSRIVISVNQNQKNVFISIKDQGIGISHDLADHIFDRFYSDKGNSNSHGLGLVVVAEIIKKYKGLIKIGQNKPVGTAVLLEFPKKQD